MESRYNSLTPCYCRNCTWHGLEKELAHTYQSGCVKCGDVEPISKCPKCGSEDIEFIRSTLDDPEVPF